MTASIPASTFVTVNPGVITAGGTALSLTGLILSAAGRVPQGQVQSFASLAAVGTYFGLSSIEYAYAQVYFLGFDNSQIKPGALLITNYNAAAVAGYQRGGNVGALGLPALQALSGTLTISTDGTSKTTGNISLAAATSFSNAATIINTALTAATSPAVCTYDAVSGGFVFTSPTTGVASSVSITGGTLAAPAYLTVATGLVTSPGAAIATPATFMPAVVAQTTNWAAFTPAFEPSATDKVAFALWTNGTNDRYAYVNWTTEAAAITQGDTTSSGAQIKAANYSGTISVYQPAEQYVGPFVLGAIASVDFTQTEGRATLAYKSQSGLAAGVTSQQALTNLTANGYNAYCAVATAAQGFNFFYPGSISGPFLWADSYVSQISLNNALQLAVLSLMSNMRSIPYNTAGYALIRQACADPITAALRSGIIRAGIPLSALQAAEVNAAAGIAIDQTLTAAGYYLQILPASAQVRAARGSPPVTLWYMDGQSVQQVTLASINVQ